MAKFEKSFTGDLDAFVEYVDQAVLTGSASASFESGTDVTSGPARLVVRVYERYSAMGGNRVSLNISTLAVGEHLYTSAITSGGSTGVFMKVLTVGEESFLDKAVSAIEDFAASSSASA
jgi:hypothetical protein